MLIREHYLKKLRELRDINLIKVVTGARRSGKSTILSQFIDELKASGVKSKNIFHYNLEFPENDKYLGEENKFALYEEISSKLSPDEKNYVFIDEVQLISEFERTVDGLFVKPNVDVYITGSNSDITSSELATYLSGRYVEIEMQPLVFSEFSQIIPDSFDRGQKFALFMEYGGFPEVANMLAAGANAQVPAYLRSLYSTILEKDIKSHKKILQIDDFEKVVAFAFENAGNSMSANNVANVLRQENRVIDNGTVSRYLSALTDCFILYKVNRFDIRGKSLLKTQSKYYNVDIGLADTILGRPAARDAGRRLENIVFLELKKRYKDVRIGQNYGKEIDFVVQDWSGNTEYFQVAESVATEATLARELESLRNTGDFFKKTLLTMDLLETSEKGIEKRNLINWLLGE